MIDNKYLKRLWSKHKASCKFRGIINELDRDDYYRLVQANCAYCDSKPSNGREFKWNGLDRINSAKGYSLDNVLTSCRFCNSLKGSMKSETWFDFLNAVKKLPRIKSIGDKERGRKSFYFTKN